MYCRKPCTVAHGVSFGIDHYRPQSKFPLDETSYANLYLCCGPCNSRKGDYWPQSPALERTQFVPNPCDHVMHQHLRFDGLQVVPRTEAGAFACEYLDLNDPAIVEFREFVNTCLEASSRQRATLAAEGARVRRRIAKGELVEAAVAADLRALEEEIAKLDRATAKLLGTASP